MSLICPNMYHLAFRRAELLSTHKHTLVHSLTQSHTHTHTHTHTCTHIHTHTHTQITFTRTHTHTHTHTHMQAHNLPCPPPSPTSAHSQTNAFAPLAVNARHPPARTCVFDFFHLSYTSASACVRKGFRV